MNISRIKSSCIHDLHLVLKISWIAKSLQRIAIQSFVVTQKSAKSVKNFCLELFTRPYLCICELDATPATSNAVSVNCMAHHVLKVTIPAGVHN